MSDTSPGITPLWDFTDFILMEEAMPCAICTKPTRWAELNFQAPLHPGPCDAQMWHDYHQANRKAGPPSGL